MHTIPDLIRRSIRWNTLEACVYQCMLWMHQVALFNVLDRTIYGHMGILFSFIYLGVTLVNLGIDTALGPFYEEYRKNKSSFLHILRLQLMPNIIAYTILIGSYIFGVFTHMITTTKLSNVPSHLFWCCIILIILESTKRTAKTFLNLLFFNKQLAQSEITYISMYISALWLLNGIGIPLSLDYIFGFMIIYSFCITTRFVRLIYQSYLALPDTIDTTLSPGLTTRLLKSRFFGFFHQIGHVIFSGNMIVPLFASLYGIEYAACVKIISTTIHTITNIAHKIIGQSSEAYLVHTKSYNGTQHKPPLIYSYQWYLVLIIIIGLSGNFHQLYGTLSSVSYDALMSICSLLLMFSCESFFVAYEKVYLVHEKGRLLWYHHMVMISLLGLWCYIGCPNPLLTLLLLSTLRISWLYVLTSIAHRMIYTEKSSV